MDIQVHVRVVSVSVLNVLLLLQTRELFTIIALQYSSESNILFRYSLLSRETYVRKGYLRTTIGHQRGSTDPLMRKEFEA